jgi:hypothetical protein
MSITKENAMNAPNLPLLASLLCASLMLSPNQTALGQDELGTIITPTGNIFCRVFAAKPEAELPATFDKRLNTTDLVCEVRTITAAIPAKPKDCEFDWGYRFVISERGQAKRACYSDVLYSPSLKRLDYGQTRKIGGFTCDLTEARLRCVNLDKRGFELSKASQRFF